MRVFFRWCSALACGTGPARVLASVLCGLLLGLHADNSLALDPTLSLAQLNHKSWLAKDGAPVSIRALAQDADGTLWIAAQTGLYRFNGLKFSRFGDAGEPALSTENINNIAVTRDGSLWISPLFGGLDRLRNGQVTHYPPSDDFPRGTVRSVAEDRDGVVWAAANGGVARFANGRWERVGAPWNLPQEPASDVVVSTQGEVWIRTLRATYRLPPGERKFHEFRRYAFADMWRQAMFAAGDGAVWGFGNEAELYRSAADGTVAAVGRSERADNGQLLLDRDGMLWLGGANGVRRLRPQLAPGGASVLLEAADTFREQDGLSAAYIGALLEDREGNIWVSTINGLDRFSNTDVVRTRLPFDGDYLALSPGPDGDLFVVGQKAFAFSISRLRGGSVVRQWPSAGVHATYRADDGSNWFASVGSLSRIAGDVQQVWKMAPEMQARPPQALVQDTDGVLWVSIGGVGIFKFNDGTWSRAPQKGLDRGTAAAAARDHKGRLWFGFLTGATMLDNGVEHVFTRQQGLDVGAVTAIHAAGERLWVGGDRGIALVDGDRFLPLELAVGRRIAGVSGIAEDRLGGLWVATYARVVHVPPNELRRFLADPSHKVRGKGYDYLDGMPGAPRQLRPTPSLVLTDDGKVWCATDTAIFHLDPQILHAAPPPPPVTLGSLLADDKPLFQPGALASLTMAAHALEINYEAWSLTVPERIRFRYRLDGVDDDWQDAGSRRTAFYTRLAPGHYTFRVTANSDNGDWNQTPATLSFDVPPAWYQTWWFRTLCALAVLLLLWRVVAWRIEKASALVANLVRTRLEERLSERERIARELHDTLLQSIQGLILSFHGAVLRLPADDALRQQLESALDRADEVLGEARDRVRDLRTSGQEDSELSQALQAAADDFRSEHAARCVTTCSGTPMLLDRTVRDEVYRVAREALLNACAHAQAQTIAVNVRYSSDALVVSVVDDGQGVPAEILDRGVRPGHWGMPGMRERSERITAQFEMHSAPGQGTSVRITVPARVAYGDAAAARETPGRWSAWLDRFKRRRA